MALQESFVAVNHREGDPPSCTRLSYKRFSARECFAHISSAMLRKVAPQVVLVRVTTLTRQRLAALRRPASCI